MVTPTTKSMGTTISVGLSTSRLVTRSQVHGSKGTPVTIFGRMRKVARRIEARNKRKAKELASESQNSLEEEEEQEDPASTSSNSEEGEGTETPSQSDPIDKPESPSAFQINRPATDTISRIGLGVENLCI